MRKYLLCVSVLLVSSLSHAGLMTLPYEFSAFTVAKSSHVNANFYAARTSINDITNAQINSAASISLSKLNLAQSATITGNWVFTSSVNVTGADLRVAGNIVIGTTTAAEMLHLHGDAAIRFDNAGGTMKALTGLADSAGDVVPGTAQGDFAFRLNSQDFRLSIDNGATSAFGVTSGNRVFIGTTTAQGILTVVSAHTPTPTIDTGADEVVIIGSGDSGMTILSGTSDRGAILFADANASASGMLRYNHSDDTLTYRAAGIDGIIQSSASVHLFPTGTADVQLEVSDGSSTGGGTIHRAASATHSSEELKTVFRTAQGVQKEEAYHSLKNLTLKEWCYDVEYNRETQTYEKAGTCTGEVRWGPTWETAPASIRDDVHRTIVIDDRIVHLELAGQAIISKLEALTQRVTDLEGGR